MGSRKGKRRNSEKRKEKSRDAARCRRNKEGEVFSALANQLPLEASLTLQQDKASIMRLAISHLKLRKLVGKETTPKDYSGSLQKKLDSQYAKTLSGFVFVLDKEGDLVYLSDNVSKYLGLTQLEMMGHSIYDFTHPCDHDEVREMLSERPGRPGDTRARLGDAQPAPDARRLLVRMKCTLTSKGKNVNLKSASYKVVSCSGRYVTAGSSSHQLRGLMDDKSLSCLLLIGEPIPHPANIEVPLDSRTFVSRHAMDMKFSYCDDRISALLRYQSQDLVGQSVYDFQHALDSQVIREAYKHLYSKGQAVIERYRYLAHGGGYCWVHTEATMVTNQRTDKPQCVVCINYVLSGVEEEDLVLSNVQMAAQSSVPALPAPTLTPAPDLTATLTPTHTPARSPAPLKKELREPVEAAEPLVLSSGMILSTSTIFAPRPLDADDDMLRITDIHGKENLLEDLDQLAPSSGDVMMPIGNFNENDLKLDYQFDHVQPATHNVFVTDPVDISANSTCSPQDLAVLDLTFLQGKNISNTSSALSGDSNQSNSVEQTEKQTVVKETLLEDEDIDFDMRAPFIPMDGDADRLFEEDWVPFLDSHGYKEMLGTTESVFGPNPSAEEETSKDNKNLPMSILRLQAASKQTTTSDGDIARNAGPPKMKRPMETNRMETGPPTEKVARVDTLRGAPPHTATSTAAPPSSNVVQLNPNITFPDMSSFFKDKDEVTVTDSLSDSVLKNLLTRGEDVNFGYKIKSPLKPPQRSQVLRSLLTTDSSTDEYDESSDDDIIMLSGDQTPPPSARPLGGYLSGQDGRRNVVVIRTSNGMLLAPIKTSVLPR